MSFDCKKMQEKLLEKGKKLQALQKKHCREDQLSLCETLSSTLLTLGGDALNTLIMVNGQLKEVEVMEYEDKAEIDITTINEIADEAKEARQNITEIDKIIANIIEFFPENKQSKAKSLTEDLKYDILRINEKLSKSTNELQRLVAEAEPNFGF